MKNPAILVVFLRCLGVVLASDVSPDTFPANEYEYSLNRDVLIAAEAKFEGNSIQLTADEQIVDHYLQYLKWEEFQATEITGFPPSRPIEEMLGYIQSTDIYKALQKFPKGGNLHSHEGHQLGKLKLFEIIWNSVDFKYLYMLPPGNPKAWRLDFFVNPPPSKDGSHTEWIQVMNSGFSMEDIVQHSIFILTMSDKARQYPTDSNLRWDEINPLFGLGVSTIIANIRIKIPFMRALYQQGFDEGVTYFETRKHLGPFEPLFEMDPSPQYASTNGKHFLDYTGDLEVILTKRLIKDIQKTNPNFIGHKRIAYSTRSYSIDKVNAEIDSTIRLHQKYPEHVIGFDIVGQEDTGNSHLYYLESFLRGYNNITRLSDIPLYMHTAETSYFDDLVPSDNNLDPVATLQNAYEALLLQAARIGHGIGFLKHPYLLDVLRQRGVGFEICLVSNQMLGYTPDLRNHPGAHFYRSGVQIALSPDDPGTFGYDNFTVDWYEAFMGWGLDLTDLKTLAINSLNISGMSATEKRYAINIQYKAQWNTYINATKTTACQADYDNNPPKFARLLPKEGPLNGASTKVHVFGRHFESAICNPVQCSFGNQLSPRAAYISNIHIVCEAPDGVASESVPISVSLDGSTFISTGLSYTYKVYNNSN